MTDITRYIAHALHGLYPPRELRSLTLMICKDLLGLDDTDIYLRKDIKLSANRQHILEDTVARMRRHEPIQYIRGVADFYGLQFHVGPGVLIPRPETEELVDLVRRETPGQVRVLDIGTGSGCIAVSLAKRLPRGRVDAWDVSEKALAVARLNAQTLGADVRFSLVDVFGDIPAGPTYDVIVSNPPYIGENEKKTMRRNVLDWEPELALFVPDDDPLRFYRQIARIGATLLAPGGKLYVEVNQAYGPQTAGLLHTAGYRYIRLLKDLPGNDRMITAIR